MAKKVIVLEVELQGVKTSVSDIQGLKAAIAGTKRELDGAKFGSDKFDKLNRQLGALETTLTDVRNVSKQAGQNFVISADQGRNSYRAMTTELNKLRATFRELSAAERQAKIGQDLTGRIQFLDRELKKVDASLGQFQRNVGNYKQGIAGFADILTGGLISGGSAAVATVGIQKISEVLQRGEKDVREYGEALADLSAILGITGNDLAKFEQAALDLQVIEVNGQQIVNTGKDIFEAFKLIGSANPELLKSEKALQDVAKAAIVLQAAAGGTLEENVNALTNTLLQFKLQASEANNVINILAAASKEGNAEIADLNASFKEAGGQARISNVSLAETAALIEILATGTLKGSEAGTQLRNILVDIGRAASLPRKAQEAFKRTGVDVAILSDTTRDFSERLVEFQKISKDATASADIFGKENAQAAITLATSGDLFEQLTTKVNNTTQAYDQAAIRANTLIQSQKNLQASITNLITSTSTGVGGLLKEATDELTRSLILLSQELEPVSDSFTGLNDTLTDLSQTITGSEERFNLLEFLFGFVNRSIISLTGSLRLAVEQLRFVLNFVNNMINSFPIIAGTIVGVRNAFNLLGDAIKSVTGAEKERQEVTGRGAGAIGFLKTAAAAEEAAEATKKQQEEEEKLRKEELKRIEAQKKSAAEAERIRIGEIGSISELQNRIAKLNDEIQKSNNIDFQKKSIQEVKDLTRELETLEAALVKLNRENVDVPESLAVRLDSTITAALELQAKLTSIDEKAADEEVKRAEGVEKAISDLKIESHRLTQEQIDEKEKQKELERKDRREATEKEIRGVSVEIAETVFNALFAIQQNQLEKQTNAQLAALDAESKRKIELAQGDEEKIRIIEFQSQQKKEQIEKEAAEKRKDIALKEAAIRGALATITALTVPPPGTVAAVLLALATTAAQIAIIASTQFAKGGDLELGFQGGRSHAMGGNRIRRGHRSIELERGEMVDVAEDGRYYAINKQSSSMFRPVLSQIVGKTFPGKKQLLSDINSYAGFGRKFALGGEVPAFVRVNIQQGAAQSGNVEVSLSAKDMNTLSANIGRQVQRGSERGTERGADRAINTNRRRDTARQRARL